MHTLNCSNSYALRLQPFGAFMELKPIAVGHSYASRGMHNDCHDAVGITITLRSAPQPASIDEAARLNNQKEAVAITLQTSRGRPAGVVA